VSTSAADRAKTRSLSRVAILTGALSLVALAGCGSSSSGTGSTASTSSSAASTPAPAATSGGQTLSLSSNPEGQLKYDTTSLTAKAGVVSINFTNTAPLSHNVTIESSSHAVLGATPTFQGGSKTLSLNLKAGVYKFYCSVPGHRMAGMEGTLTVN
jgi:plastocyanin